MKTLLGAALLSASLLVLSAGPRGDAAGTLDSAAPVASVPSVASTATAHAPALAAPEDLTKVVQTYCVVCHNDQLMTGNLTLQQFDVAGAAAKAETAEKMIVKLRAEMMPPPGIPRPQGDTLLQLATTLETLVDKAAEAAPNPGVRRFQRLNQPEYERVIRDLLGLEVDAANWLPADTYLANFDNLSAAQGLSTTLLEAYMRAATEVSRLALGNRTPEAVTRSYRNPFEITQHAWDHVEGTPYGTRGGMVVTHDFPADGQYVFTLHTLHGKGIRLEDIDVSIDGDPVALLAIPANGNTSVPIMTDPVFVRAGQHQVAAAFVRHIDGPYEDRLHPHDWSLVGGDEAWADYGITALPHLRGMDVAGPNNPTGVSDTPSRQKVFSCRPASSAQERSCAESIVKRLAMEAYRRPVTDDDLSGLMGFYDRAAAQEGFEVGVRTALQGILASPFFVFRFEDTRAGAKPGQVARLSDVALASRLSFFLWGTVPDEELVKVAGDGKLSDAKVLEREVQRMLADPRSEALATRFASQWLRLQDVAKVQPEPYFFPDFNRQLSRAMTRETELFFYDLVKNDRSVLDLFRANYSFMNESLARYYGITGPVGEEFQKVQYPADSHRQGLLGHGSILTLTSMANRTSPVLRGKWVMEVLLGTPPPPPPPGIPDLAQTVGAKDGRTLTTRERMEIHSASPVCKSCHQYIDPMGLALDNFDVTGKWRMRENGAPLDTRGTFYDGTPVSTAEELTNVLLKRPTPLLRTFTRNLLAYAVGRRMEYFDEPTIRLIVKEAEKDDYRMSSFIMGVVNSAPFEMKAAEPVETQN